VPPIRDVDGVACTRRPPASSCRTRRTSTTVALANTFPSAAVLSSSSSSSLAHAPRLCPTVVARTPVAATVAQPARDTITSPHWPSAIPPTTHTPKRQAGVVLLQRPVPPTDRLCRASNSLQPDARQRHFAPIVDTALLARPVHHTRRPDSTAMLRAATHEPVLSLHLVVADLATDNLAPAARPHTRSTCTTSHPPTTLRPQRRSAFVITSRRRHATAARRQQRRLHQRLTLLFSTTLDTCRRSPHTPLADTSR